MNIANGIWERLVDADAEASLIGAVVATRGAVSPSVLSVPEGAFATPAHQRIWRAVLRLVREGREVDPVLLAEHGAPPAEVARCLASVPSTVAAEQYAERVMDLYTRRVALQRMQDAAQRILNGGPLADALGGVVDAIAGEVGGVRVRRLRDALQEAAAVLADGGATEIPVRGVPGFGDSDALPYGVLPGRLMLIAGMTSAGKTAYALQIALALAQEGRRVAFVSLEMAAEHLAERVAASVLGYTRRQLRDNPQHIVTVGVPPTLEVVEVASNTAREATLAVALACQRAEVVFVDHLDEVQVGSEPHREYERLLRSWRSLARRTGAALVVLHQFNRQQFHRAQKRPVLSDISYGGDKTADVIIALHRPSVVGGELPPGVVVPDGFDYAEAVLVKNRYGPAYTVVPCLFDEAHQRFVLADARTSVLNLEDDGIAAGEALADFEF